MPWKRRSLPLPTTPPTPASLPATRVDEDEKLLALAGEVADAVQGGR